MIDILQQILDFFKTIGDFLVQFFKNLLTMISMIPKFLDVVLSFFSFLPDWLLPTLLIVLFAGVILYLLGR